MDTSVATLRMVLLTLAVWSTAMGVAMLWVARIAAWDGAAAAAGQVLDHLGPDWDCATLPPDAGAIAADAVVVRLPPEVTPTVLEVSAGERCSVRVSLVVRWFRRFVLAGWTEQVATVCRPAGPALGGPAPLVC